MRVVLVSLLSFSALLLLALILYFILKDDPIQSHLNLNATCKFENVTGKCKRIDSCITNSTTITLEPCNESESSIVCCPIEETETPNNLVQIDKYPINNRPKRTPGEKAKEMCTIYGKTAYRRVPNPTFIGPEYFEEIVCEIHEPLIKGGAEAKEKEFPHMALIGNFEADGLGQLNWVCGGSIVSPEFILSAAHCNVSKEYGFAMVGTNRMEHNNEFFAKHVISISDVFIHPDYNAINNNNDIALFKLSTKLSINERPICLDTGTPIFNNMMVIATGFGFDKAQKPSDVLQKISLNIVDQALCATKYKRIQRALPQHPVCAYAEGNDTCRGDSGGPLQIPHGGFQCMYTLIGVTSFGMKCDLETTIPGVYTKVYPYLGWIEDIVWPA